MYWQIINLKEYWEYVRNWIYIYIFWCYFNVVNSMKKKYYKSNYVAQSDRLTL
jgi:hypothetical protein